MRKQYIKGTDQKPFEIVEDDRNDQPAEAKKTTSVRRYEVKLDKLSQATKDTIKKPKG